MEAIMTRAEMETLMRGVEEHADPERGLSNDVVERFCRLITSPSFRGTFSADCIPPRVAKEERFCIVVNLGVRKGRRGPLPVGHFVAVIGDPWRVRYFDSYGLLPTQPHVVHFLRSCKRRVVVRKRQVQDFDSKCCGLYAALYATYYDPGRKKRPAFYLHFNRRRLKSNDALCVRYLRRLIYE